ncbi:hypothetical protein [Emticicia sp.]|uniref:hypothetical protein n=1 Tax=Emticicia sp. TaxID=1930953 RepID=UPI003751A3B4
MKQIIIIFFLSVLVFMPEFSQASESKLVTKMQIQKANDGGRKNKSGSYRKKKGFMWGIFRGKNQCDCPKH